MEMYEWQEWTEEFNKKRGWDAKSQPNTFEDMNALLEEAGELAREVRRYENNGVRQGHKESFSEVESREMLMEEIGDLQFMVFTIANRYNIPMEEVMYRFSKKMSERVY